MKFYGHVVSYECILVDPTKVEALFGWQPPTTMTKIKSSLRFVGYYRRFIKHFSNIVVTLKSVTKKNTTFVWNLKGQDAFDEIKKLLTMAPVLIISSGDKMIIV